MFNKLGTVMDEVISLNFSIHDAMVLNSWLSSAFIPLLKNPADKQAKVMDKLFRAGVPEFNGLCGEPPRLAKRLKTLPKKRKEKNNGKRK
jgi:hypothetical protein